MSNQLSTKQKRMAELMLEGHSAVFAYKEAGYKGSPEKCAHIIRENSAFKDHLAKLQLKSETSAVATRAEILENASDIMRDNKANDARTSLAAGDQIAKLTGEYAPERFKAEVTLTPIEQVMKNLRRTGKVNGIKDDE